MVQRCEHCGQTVIATDKQCWHCGKVLSHGKPQLLRSTQSATAVVSDAPPMPPFTTILLYASLTAVALFILIATIRALGQAPLFLASSDTIPQVGWQPITDSQFQFTLNLPKTWHVFELALAPEALTLRGSPPLQAVEQVLETLAADTQPIFLGTEDTAVFADGAPVFVLVAQSQRLQQLSPEQLLTYAQQQLPENVALSAINQLDVTTEGQTQTSSLLFNIEQGEALWRCVEKIDPSHQGVYLVVTCTSFAQFPLNQSDFETILRSFQQLDS